MKQILCINSSFNGTPDPHVKMVQEKLGNKIKIITFDPTSYPMGPQSYELQANGLFKLVTNKDQFENIKAIWYRKPQFLSQVEINAYIEQKTQKKTSEYGKFCFKAYSNMSKMIYGTYSYLPWVSDYWAVARANNRIINLEEAVKVGFSIPKTLITSDPEKAFDFYIQNKKTGVIAKSIQVEYIEKEDDRVFTLFTTSLPQDMKKEEFLGLNLNPVIFQEKIDKVADIRVNVVGTKVYACEIRVKENELDWRKKDIDKPTIYIPHKLPDVVSSQCVNFVKNAGLKFGAIDLALNKEWEYVYFECNPNGQWAFCELEAGLPISEGFADLFTDLIGH